MAVLIQGTRPNGIHKLPSPQGRLFSYKSDPSSIKRLYRSPSNPTSALEALLANPIRFVPATYLTEEDEMVVQLRPRTVKGDTAGQQRRRAHARPFSTKWQVPARVQPVGMKNFNKDSCYRHAALQALLHLPIFGNWLVDGHPPHKCFVGDCVACHLRTLYTDYWSENQDPAQVNQDLINIQNLCIILGWAGTTGHQDAEEWLGWLLQEMMHQVDRIPEEILRLIFGIRVRSTVVCRECKHASHSDDPGDMQPEKVLRLALPADTKKPQLVEYMRRHMEEEIEPFICSACAAVGPVTRRYAVLDAPEVLLVSLLRFDPATGGKTSRRVHFGQYLDLDKYVSSPAQRPLRYKLVATVNHWSAASPHGKRRSLSARFGHYITIAQGPRGRWHMLNDEDVARSSAKSACHPETLLHGLTPYILVYTRLAQGPTSDRQGH